MKSSLSLVAVGLVVWGVGVPAATGAQGSPVLPSATSNPDASSNPEVQALRERAATYWAARLAGDNQRQWELLEPRGRGRLTVQEYAEERQGGSIKYLGYSVGDATIDGYFAIVKVRVLFQAVIPMMTSIAPSAVVMDDRWIQVGGAWFHQLDKPQRPGREP